MQPWLWLVLAALCGTLAFQQAPELVMQVLTHETATLTCKTKSYLSKTTIYWLRWLQDPSSDSHYEFLVSWDFGKEMVYSSGMSKEKLTASQETLSLKDVTSGDSGIYFCMTVGSPELIFGKRIQLNVVDAPPTTIRPTRKTTKKKMCRLPKPVTQKGPRCGLITLSLMGAGILVLLVSLGVSIRLCCLRRRARLHFMKQFHK
ncbi:T-cell surface glycoprotein CD8 beta chain [Thomomys bottae]